MAYASPYNDVHGLSQIDGETIQALYTRLHGQGKLAEDIGRRIIQTEHLDNFDDWGPWDETVIRYSGTVNNIPYLIPTREEGGVISDWTTANEDAEVAFGVDWRNGLARPWISIVPREHNEFGAVGTATYKGGFVGFTPSQEAVRGDSMLQVDFAALDGSAAFTALEHWESGAAPGNPGTGKTWKDGDLRYSISVDNVSNHYLFRSDGGDDGYIFGRFVGLGAEGKVGILEHPHLTGAFGGTRQAE